MGAISNSPAPFTSSQRVWLNAPMKFCASAAPRKSGMPIFGRPEPTIGMTAS